MAGTRSKSVKLPSIVDLDALDPIRDELLDAIEAGAVRIEASHVERIATNGLLMLISAAETARRNQIPFGFDAMSANMTAAISRLGLTGHFTQISEGL